MAVDLTISRNGPQYWGSLRAVLFRLVGPASYVPGGIPTSVQDVLLGTVDVMPDIKLHSGTAVRLAVYDYVNSKYVVYVPNTGSEVAGGQDLSTFSGRGVALGR